MNDRLTISIDDGVADVRLNRPDKMNALDGPMFDALVAAGDRLAADDSVRAVVLSGEGRAFCAGLDFSGFVAMAGDDDASMGSIGRVAEGRITHHAQQACWTWHEIPVPVIAAVHGVAFGGGLQLALGADIRIVAADVRMAILEIRWGLSPDMTATQVLPRLVGPDMAKELTWTGREVGGEEAVRIGLATHISDDPRTAALELAREIASKSPHAIRGAKHLIDFSMQADWSAGFAEERRVIGSLISGPNQVEAVHAYFEKRPAAYRDFDSSAP